MVRFRVGVRVRARVKIRFKVRFWVSYVFSPRYVFCQESFNDILNSLKYAQLKNSSKI